MDDGYNVLLWLGKMLDPAFVSAVFGAAGPPGPEVGRCRLTVSKPQLKAPLVSALDTKM